MFAQAHSTLIHSPGSRLSLRLWLHAQPELGMKKCCHLVDISCNDNLPTSADWHLQLGRPMGLLKVLRQVLEINSKYNRLSRSLFQRSTFLTPFKQIKKEERKRTQMATGQDVDKS